MPPYRSQSARYGRSERAADRGSYDRSAPPEGVDIAATSHTGAIDTIVYPKPGSAPSSNGFLIARLRGLPGASIKGNIVEPVIGAEYQFAPGRWVSDNYGWTFVFTDATPVLPTSTDGMAAYLAAHCKFVGASTAARIVEAFGVGSLEVCKSDPARVAATIRGVTPDRAAEIQSALVARAHLEAVEVDVRSVVSAAGVNARQLRAILDLYRGQAAEVCRRNPYRLAEEVDGIGFATADAIALTAGIDRNDAARIRAGLFHTLSEAASGEGHTCLARYDLVDKTTTLLGIDSGLVDARVTELCAVRAAGLDVTELVAHEVDGVERVYKGALYVAESEVASAMLRLLRPAPAETKARVPERIAEAASRATVSASALLPASDPAHARLCETLDRMAANRPLGMEVSSADIFAARRPARSPLEHFAASAIMRLDALNGDRATQRNGVGFNAFDSAQGKQMAEDLRRGIGLTPRGWAAALRIVPKYRGQVGESPAEASAEGGTS